MNGLAEELRAWEQAVRERAYERFRNGGSADGAVGDWLAAEDELVWKPAVEMREKDGRIEVRAAVAGVDPESIELQVTADRLLLEAPISHQHDEGDATVYLCEFRSGPLRRSIRFPKKVNPDTVKAECRDGLLHVTADVAGEPALASAPLATS
jgi:HSP20 family molecular chaperone IbpA